MVMSYEKQSEKFKEMKANCNIFIVQPMVNSLVSPNAVRAIPVCLYHKSLFVTQNSNPFYTGRFMKYGYHCRCNQKSSGNMAPILNGYGAMGVL
jgi:hypothetical protein